MARCHAGSASFFWTLGWVAVRGLGFFGFELRVALARNMAWTRPDGFWHCGYGWGGVVVERKLDGWNFVERCGGGLKYWDFLVLNCGYGHVKNRFGPAQAVFG